MREKIYVIVAAFRSDPVTVVENLRNAVPQVSGLVIVDNSNVQDEKRWEAAEGLDWAVRVIFNGDNLGPARAFNQGIEVALEERADLILLLDDDSQPAPAMVERLAAAWRERAGRGERVAAVGPNFRDRHSRERAVFVQIDGTRLQRIRCRDGDGIVPSEYLMSSGSLIPRSTLLDVGLLEEDLFIDYVDMEWCLRARARGYRCYGVCAAHMEHGLGDRQLSVSRLLRRSVPLRAPIRHYFIFRNTLLLMRRPYMPARWKLNALKRIMLLPLLYLSSAPGRLQHLRCMGRGVLHGLVGHSGPAPAGLEQ